MKMIVLRCSILAAIIFIPLTSIQHFIEPLDDCLLADICNHTWIPECAEDENIPHRRLFIDECDIWEFNCDNNVKYLIVNYSDCFGPQTCPTLKQPKFLRQGNFLYGANGRRLIYSPTRKTTLPMTKPGKRRYTPQRGRRLKKPARRTTECAPCMRTTTRKAVLRRVPGKPRGTTKKTTKRTTKRTTRGIRRAIVTTRFTTQVIQTATVGTVVLRRVTVIKNGMLLYKVIKGYASVATTTKEDSDFLE